MGITVTGLDSNSSPNGTLWEAHDRVQVTVTYPWKLDVIGLSALAGHDDDRRPRRSSSSRAAAARQNCSRSCGQRASSLLRPVTGTSSPRQSAVSTAACSAPASHVRSAPSDAPRQRISARTASRALTQWLEGQAQLGAEHVHACTGPSTRVHEHGRPGRRGEHRGRRQPGHRDAAASGRRASVTGRASRRGACACPRAP